MQNYEVHVNEKTAALGQKLDAYCERYNLYVPKDFAASQIPVVLNQFSGLMIHVRGNRHLSRAERRELLKALKLSRAILQDLLKGKAHCVLSEIKAVESGTSQETGRNEWLSKL
jgi:hypothetical protein